jgi:hypothetical protein
MASTILSVSRRYWTRSDVAFRERRLKNEQNWRAYLGLQDFSFKADYQSKETTPGFPIAIEHVVGTFERALTDSDDWLAADPASPAGKPFLEPAVIQDLTQFYLERLWKPGNHPETAHGISVVVGDACKRGILEPTVIAKVFPVLVKRRHFKLEQTKPREDMPVGELNPTEYTRIKAKMKPVDVDTMRLAIELIPYEDYFPDPSDHCRYEIHRTRRNLYDLLANPEYDKAVIRSLIGMANDEMVRRNAATANLEHRVGPDPYEIEVFEGWGDIIDHETGEVMVSEDGVTCQNVVWTWAGDKIIRKPTPNPFWDGTRPFIAAPMVRVPGSVEGKAMADHAVPMWKAMNEMVNLLLDQAMRAAWGVGQVRTDIMESPEEVADGIPQGYTAVLKPNTPMNMKFYERVDNGEAPQITIDQLQRFEGFLQESMATPDTKLGQIPQRATKATEIVQAMQSAGSLYESFAARFEDTFLEPIFEKCWKIILQYADSLLEPELVQILGPTNALRLLDMSAAERFKLCHSCTFKVRGLRGVQSRERFFNKLMTVVNLLASNQQFADHFGQSKDYGKLWDQLLRAAGIDPISLDSDDSGDQQQETPPPGSANGQLNPALAGSSGASAPNVQADAAAAAGAASNQAPNNPAGNQAVA